MTELIAYHGSQETKDFYVNRAKEHQRLDELVKGIYFEDGEPGKRRMCAVGCTIHSDDHSQYEPLLGVPEWLARVEDSFFEHMPDENAKQWPVQFLEAIPVGANLENVKATFHIYILEQALSNFDHAEYPDVKRAVDTVIGLWKTDPTQSDRSKWNATRSAAYSATSSAAYSAAYSAARSATYSATEATSSAAYSAAYSAARSATYSATEAAYSATSSAAYSAARSATSSAAYLKYSEKLLELMRACK